LSGIYSTPLLGVAYRLAEAQSADVSYSTSVNGPSQVYHFSYVDATDILTLLIKVPAMVAFCS